MFVFNSFLNIDIVLESLILNGKEFQSFCAARRLEKCKTILSVARQVNVLWLTVMTLLVYSSTAANSDVEVQQNEELHINAIL